MGMYRKRPVVVEAVQFDPSVQPWPEGVHAMVGPWADTACHAERLGVSPADCGWVPTLEGGHVTQRGDRIITGANGERYPCKPGIFAATYELVEP